METLAFPFFHTDRCKFAVMCTLLHGCTGDLPGIFPELHILCLVSLHTRISVCRTGNNTHLEKALSFSDFRAQSQHSTETQRWHIQLWFLQWCLALHSSYWLKMSAYWFILTFFRTQRGKTGTKLMSNSSFARPEQTSARNLIEALGSAASYWPDWGPAQKHWQERRNSGLLNLINKHTLFLKGEKVPFKYICNPQIENTIIKHTNEEVQIATKPYILRSALNFHGGFCKTQMVSLFSGLGTLCSSHSLAVMMTLCQGTSLFNFGALCNSILTEMYLLFP